MYKKSNPNLKEVIDKAKETGILRLEITFYRYNTETVLTKEIITNNINSLREISQSNSVYKNSNDNKYNLVCNKVTQNVWICDEKNKMNC